MILWVFFTVKIVITDIYRYFTDIYRVFDEKSMILPTFPLIDFCSTFSSRC